APHGRRAQWLQRLPGAAHRAGGGAGREPLHAAVAPADRRPRVRRGPRLGIQGRSPAGARGSGVALRGRPAAAVYAGPRPRLPRGLVLPPRPTGAPRHPARAAVVRPDPRSRFAWVAQFALNAGPAAAATRAKKVAIILLTDERVAR